MDDDYEMIGALTHSELNAEIRKLESLKKRLLEVDTLSDNFLKGAWYARGLLDMLDFITVHRSGLPSIILEQLVVAAELSGTELKKLHSNITICCCEADKWV